MRIIFDEKFLIFTTKGSKMITQIAKSIKYITQKIYNKYISSITFSTFSCSCGSIGRFTKHGFYTRSIKNPSGKVKISIQRIKCSSCDKTHAVLHHSMVPYSQIPLCDTLKIIKHHENNKSFNAILDNNPEITESDVRYTIKRYLKYWKEKIFSISLIIPILDFLVSDDLHKVVSSSFKQAFMQIKRSYYQAF